MVESSRRSEEIVGMLIDIKEKDRRDEERNKVAQADFKLVCSAGICPSRPPSDPFWSSAGQPGKVT
jgi:hypothetical protein